MPGAQPGGSLPTPGGRVGVLDKELEEQLVIFDEKVLDARRKVLEDPGRPGSEPSEDVELERQRTGAAAGGEGSGDEQEVATTEGGETGGTEGSESADEEATADAEPGAPQSSGGGQTPETSEAMAGGGQVPDDIPDGQDDDIVARQLRELAMAERDPELREKYWDEYRRYKEGTGK